MVNRIRTAGFDERICNSSSFVLYSGFFFVECVSAIAIHSISLSKSINLRNSNS